MESEVMNDDKILVEIASYCDSELFNTINSALIQADFPDRVCFAVCYQNDDENGYEELKKIKNCKVTWLKENETKGSCYARYLCQKMITDEKYIYQIDSHMRFVKHWDTCLINELLSLNDDKAIISFYPIGFKEGMLELPLDDEIFDTPTDGGLMRASFFRSIDSPFLKISSDIINKDSSKAHIKSVFISAGNFFSFSEAHKTVLHDTDMYFYGDELFMSIKLFTYGWNVYNSGISYIYHQYHRSNQKFPYVKDAMKIESEKFNNLLENRNNKELLEKYQMGKERTIDEFEKFAGIDFKNKIIYMNAETGEIENDQYIGKISCLGNRAVSLYKKQRKEENIEVLVVDLFGDYKECINGCINNSIYKDKIKFIVGTRSKNDLSDIEKTQMNIKKIMSFPENTNYCEILHELTQHIGNCYVTIVDSSIRFLNGWDEYLCQNIKLCGHNAVLTNWIWLNNNLSNVEPYYNIIKKVDYYNKYLPILKYIEDFSFANVKNPQHSAFFFNGFLFLHSRIIKKIQIDPILNYSEHKYLYAIRLWTNGIDIYIPKLSYFYRIREEKLLRSKDTHNDIVCSLSGIHNSNTIKMERGYKYDIGDERPLWSWYDFIGVDYDTNEMKIIK